MQNKVEISFEGDHVRVVAEGDKDYQFMVRLWSEVAAACTKHDCYKVLGVANTSTPVEAVEGYDLPHLFHDLDIDHRYRIAWVEIDDNARHMTAFIETVLTNRGLPGQLFDDEEAALACLRKD